MLHHDGKKDTQLQDALTRRDFLRAGTLGAGTLGLSLADLAGLQAAGTRRDINCILLFLVGGPSQLDTWDLKPNAPSDVRGPFRPIRTNVSGIDICEHFPFMAGLADRYAIVRSVHHAEAPIHETGQQMMQTGHLFRSGMEYPHYGAVLSHLHGPRQPGLPPFVVLPAAVGNTGVSVSHGQGAGYLGAKHEPFVLQTDPARLGSMRAVEQNGAALFAPGARQAFDLAAEPDSLRRRYGTTTFGQSCLLARRLIEHGVRLVTVNMFDTVFDNITWDCHADGGSLASSLDDYKRTLCPTFDAAYSALLEDLSQRGLLDTTLVLAIGEFGRTPQLNPRGGRDHWPGAWSVLFAGAGVRGGQVVGSTDRTASEPRDRPVTPAQVAATVYRALGIDPGTTLAGPEGKSMPLIEAEAIEELFRG